MYCIYTDQEVPLERGNWDHVIPLSLGGQNQFQVWSEIKTNSTLGSRVDGAIVKDPLIAFALREAAVKGHSGKAREPHWKNALIDGRPAQITWTSAGPRVWDAKTRSYLDAEEIVGKEISSKLTIDYYSAIRFAAKAALGGGYFVYGDTLRTAMDCDELRRLMWLDVEKARLDPAFRSSRTTVSHRFHADAMDPQHEGYHIRVLTEFTGRSIFIAVPHDDAISFHIGVAGVYIGTITCEADTSSLPNDDALFDLGHVVLLAPGEMERLSYRELAKRWWKLNTGEEAPSPPA